MKFLLALIAAAFLAGCATEPRQAYNDWMDKGVFLAESGQKPFSALYIEAISKAYALPEGIDKIPRIAALTELIKQAKRYEAGEITRSQLDDIRRDVRLQYTIAVKQAHEAEEDKNRAIKVQAYQSLAEMQRAQAAQPSAAMPMPYMLPAPQPIQSAAPVCSTSGGVTVCR